MVLWQRLASEVLSPKWVISGMPKSGLHLLELMVAPVSRGVPPDGVYQDEWVGTFGQHAWTAEWLPVRGVMYRLARVGQGQRLKGHLGWNEEVERLLWGIGAAHVFVYRDLRDVAVSQAHHVLSRDDRRFQHDGKALYRSLGSFEAVLEAVVRGIGPYAGLVERWLLYEPWLRCEWGLCVKYEELLEEPVRWAREMLTYGYERLVGSLGLECRLDEDELAATAQRMAETGGMRHLSPTFRKGEPGGWQEAWTDGVQAAFVEMGGGAALERAGYGFDEGWRW